VLGETVAGARIGFGTTDQTAVTTWYEITAITNDTTLTINAPATVSPSTPYVIEEIRIALGSSGSGGSFVIIHNGVFLMKGLNYSTFTNVDAFIDKFLENIYVQRFIAIESESELRTQVQKRKFVLQNIMFSLVDATIRATFVQGAFFKILIFDFDTETWDIAP